MAKSLQQEFTLTRHAQDRIKERFPLAMEEVMFEQSAAMRNRKMYEFLWNATVENRVINDTMFMQYVREKYGYDKTLKFFANRDMLFIGVITPDGNFIVTVVNRDNYASRYLRTTERKLQKKPDTFRVRHTTRHYNLTKKKHREHLETDYSDYE